LRQKITTTFNLIAICTCIDDRYTTELQEASSNLKLLMDQPLEADDACAIKAYTTLASIIDDTSTDDLQQQKGLSDLRIHIPDVVCLVGCRSVSPYDEKSSNEWSKKWLGDGLWAAA